MLTLRQSGAETTRARQKPAGPIRRFFRKEKVAGYLFISPWLIGFLAFQLYPLLDTVYNSFTKLGLFGPPQWVGLQNYQQLFTIDDDFRLALGNMVLYVVGATVIYILGGLILALALQNRFPGHHAFRIIFYMPSLMVGVGIGAMMVQVFNSQNYGLINYFLSFLHIPPVTWLNNYDHPIMGVVALVIVSFWFMGGAMLIFIAGLKGISRTYYEAARLDGANAWQCFHKVTLPLLTPVLLFNTVMTLISNIQAFALPLIFAGGGGGSVGSVTSVLGYRDSLSMFLTYLYQEAFVNHKYGYASALAMVIFVISLILTAIVLVIFQRFTHYQEQ
ncbi:MAG TPA: sugar ABC transporter permease [Ktedonobacteraceae bacterium]|nr:sugar ABC transporter permease [Ktedonobacteraceae bacterium]